MISILSPAKTLDMSPIIVDNPTFPRFQKETNQLALELKKYNPEKLSKLMHLSEKLSLLNSDRYQNFSKGYDMDNSTPSIHCFKGGVYVGLNAADFSSEEINFSQHNVRILSGLYGLLRPLDLMQAYRLEMGTKIPISNYKNLYAFWGDKITSLLQEDIKQSGSNVLINLASQEYFKVVKIKNLTAKVITIHFKEYRDDKLKFISFNAKKARGLMSRYIVKNNIINENDLHGFDYEGYYYDEKMSTTDEWMFVK